MDEREGLQCFFECVALLTVCGCEWREREMCPYEQLVCSVYEHAECILKRISVMFWAVGDVVEGEDRL